MDKIEESKRKKIEQAMAAINKQFGDGSIMKMTQKPEKVACIPTGSLLLDDALGCGGWPKGRIVEIYGPESSGKTTLCLHAIAECQKQGGIAAFVDAEHAFDPNYAENLGVDLDNLLLSQPDYGEQGLQIVDQLVLTNSVDLIIVDSVAALIPKSELEGEMGDSSIGVHARLMAQACRKLTGIIGKSKATVIFINQIRLKIGVVYGNPEVTTGGNSLKFASSIRVEIRKGKAIEKSGETIGNETKIKIVKNKLGNPHRDFITEIFYGKGIIMEAELVELATNLGIIQKAGSWYSYGETKLGQGKPGVVSLLQDNPELFDEIYKKVKGNV